MNIKNLIMNLLYPPQCVFCGTRLLPDTKLWVCHDCANNVQYCMTYKRCERCGKPVPKENGGLCNECYTRRLHTTKITSALVYVDLAKDGVIRFKNRNNSANAYTLSHYIATMVKTDFKNIEFDTVVSVPARKKNTSKTGYDQAGKLAYSVALHLGISYSKNVLEQIRPIKKQSSMKYYERLENAKGNFRVKRPEKTKNKTVLLVDDVRTSGATINECARVLKESGAYKVYGATLATVPAF